MILRSPSTMWVSLAKACIQSRVRAFARFTVYEPDPPQPRPAIRATHRKPQNTDRTIPSLENIAELSHGVRYVRVGSAMMC